MGTTPLLMDTLSTASNADLPSVCRRSTVRSGIFKTVDDFQDFDVGGPGWHPGAEPGLDPKKADGGHASMSTLSAPCDITVVDFSHHRLATHRRDNETLAAFMNLPQPEWVKCRWVNVNGLSWDDSDSEDSDSDFFESSAVDVETPIIRRQTRDTIVRQSCDASMVGQAIINAIIDLAMPVITCYTEVIGDLELDMLTKLNIKHTKSLYILVTEMNKMLGFINPVITLINALRDHKRKCYNT
ncbi:unnamed protein product [Sordaria macrospora k-hell]|uniref:WGS project CABT00000000 data, contig 2.18 n=1 Tax=Sordaria macrospora (strain ATCC MYA-333 / DSM 997 / K(L3346) / K-hell) TaxID=771870 RepID=F7W0Y3_SORMK|nr:uncharacterized protein SMAC_02093 [Sordaria macrospora k-hell]CCC11435.1 unnamed protein product [Sordaria macrospora k-hell]